jgi:hypothetical protein
VGAKIALLARRNPPDYILRDFQTYGSFRKGATMTKCICGALEKKHKSRRMYEEVITDLGGGKVTGVMRSFIVNCPVHGERAIQRAAGHATQSKLKEEFSKAERVIVKRKLDDDERQVFDKAIRGRYLPNPEQIKRWRKLADE